MTSCRKLLLMSVNSVNDDPERVCTTLLQFEREQGIFYYYYYYYYYYHYVLLLLIINIIIMSMLELHINSQNK